MICILFILVTQTRWCYSSSAIIPASQYSQIIVVSDIHGDEEALLMSLYSGYSDIAETELTSIVDFQEFRTRFDIVIATQAPLPFGPLRTTPDVAVVQMGDLVDRGKFSLKCLLIMRAIRLVLGYDVFQVLGNHELAPAIDAKAVYSHYRHPDDDMDWYTVPEKIHRPTGVFYKEIFSNFQPIVRLDGGENIQASTLFVHAGIHLDFIERIISPSNHSLTPNELVNTINRAIKTDLGHTANSDRSLLELYISPESLFSTRHYERKLDCDALEKVLELFQVSRIIVGHMANVDAHTVRPLRCFKIHENRPVVILSDIATSRYMEGFSRDTSQPYPGSILIRLSPLTGNIYSMVALYLDPINQEISSRDTSLLLPGLSVEKARIIIPENEIVSVASDVIFEDNFVSMRLVQTHTMSGIVLNITNFDNQQLQKTLRHFDLVRDSDFEDDIAFDLPDIYDILIDGKRALFVETSAVIPLGILGIQLSRGQVENLKVIIESLHRANICLGLFVASDEEDDFFENLDHLRSRFLDMFAISNDQTSLDFVNFSRIRICMKDEENTEMENFVDAFHDELYPDETTDDDEDFDI